MRSTQPRNIAVADTVRNASRQIWLAGLGAAALTRDWAESGAAPMFRSLVKEGTLVEARTLRVVGDRLDRSYTRANAAWHRTRSLLSSGVREAATSAVSIVQKNLPRSLPQVKLPSMLAAAPARKPAAKRAKKATTARRGTRTAKRTRARVAK